MSYLSRPGDHRTKEDFYRGDMSDKTSWGYLPTEIRYMIFQLLLRDSRISLATLATVSREWQTVIEQHNFARIKLTPSRIADFGSVIHRNRGLVSYIWLCLELEEYDCTKCASENYEDWGMSKPDNLLISTAFQDLFSILNTWKPGGDLVLDISMHSPSDAEHWFKYLTFEPDARSDQGMDRWHQSQCEEQPMPLKFVDCHRGLAPDKFGKAIFKVFEEFDYDWIENEWWEQLPLVPAVTGVLLRQQTRRRWRPAALAGIFGRLPGLQEIHFEPWREWEDVDGRQQGWTDTGKCYTC